MNPKPVDSVATEFGPFLCGNEMTLGFVKSTLFLGTAIGCLGIGFFMDNIGRKFSLHLINFCQLLGFTIMLIAPRIEVIAVGYFAYAFIPFFRKKKANKSCGKDSCSC